MLQNHIIAKQQIAAMQAQAEQRRQAHLGRAPRRPFIYQIIPAMAAIERLRQRSVKGMNGSEWFYQPTHEVRKNRIDAECREPVS
jgi:hypothetical protein